MAERADLLIELGCEELPPKALDRIAAALYDGLLAGLKKAQIEFDPSASRLYATPRRLAAHIGQVASRQPDQRLQRRGPALSAAFDSDGKPTPAASGFARSVGREVAELERLKTDKGEWLYVEIEQAGQSLTELLYPLLKQVLNDLPVPKPMRWGNHEYSFVRPVHWLLALHGDQVLEGNLFGQSAGRLTRGHRIHAPEPLTVSSPAYYEPVLLGARVIADPERRKAEIRRLATEQGEALGARTQLDDDLLDEVKNLVEWPVALSCSFEEEFLSVPAEALIASMQIHQKFFPVLSVGNNQLTPRFIAIANLESAQPEAVIQGFERVIRPRLADARFFWDQDLKQPLEQHYEALGNIVFHRKLGTIKDKCERVAGLSMKIAELLGIDPALAGSVSRLAKCDLLSQMVNEFPDLQGIMGRYYALAEDSDVGVANAIAEHYLPRFAGDTIPTTALGMSVALADRLDSLVGIFAIGEKPTGTKDPFALRRAALGVVRIIQEGNLDLSLEQLLAWAGSGLVGLMEITGSIHSELSAFVLERLRNHYRELGFKPELFKAVTEVQSDRLLDVDHRVRALADFMRRPEAESLAAANKRIGNILRKADPSDLSADNEINPILEEEKKLLAEINAISEAVSALSKNGDYAGALDQLASLKPAVDGFFDHVMVMEKDSAIRRSRLALVRMVQAAFSNIANLSALG